MNSKLFSQALKSYMLSGTIGAGDEIGVHWSVVEGQMRVGFEGIGRQFMGDIRLPVSDIPEGTYPVINSTEWVRMVDLMGANFGLTTLTDSNGEIYEVTMQGDNNFVAQMRVAERSVIEDKSKVFKYAVEKKYEGNGLLSAEFTNNFAQAAKALKSDKKTSNVVFSLKGNTLTTTIGGYSKVSFTHEFTDELPRQTIEIEVQMEPVLEMFDVNKKCQGGEIGIGRSGMMLNFIYSDELTCRYYIPRAANNN